MFSGQPVISDPITMGRSPVELTPYRGPAREVRELEEHHRELLNPATTRELTSLVGNLNRLLKASVSVTTNTALRSLT